VTLEPGLYEPAAGGFGVRLEDLALLTHDALENLTPLPYELDPRAWR
jgi:Xaa-Pro aminopeptidase